MKYHIVLRLEGGGETISGCPYDTAEGAEKHRKKLYDVLLLTGFFAEVTVKEIYDVDEYVVEYDSNPNG